MEKIQLKKTIEWALALVPSSLIASFISLTFIWLYLIRLGRQDLFMDFVNLNDALGALAAFSLLSILSFGLVFYLQSFLAASLLVVIPERADNERIKNRRTILLLISSIFSVLLFYFSVFIDSHFNQKINIGIHVTLNCLLCITLSYFHVRKTAPYDSDKKIIPVQKNNTFNINPVIYRIFFIPYCFPPFFNIQSN
ncbi:hypothetical protein RHD99_13430 [Buttiauxella selenatireducens]|uniref:Uncharacterized protein n=1 Tax=Buttiauxella selenatireducens TaxID=3073902 RepID=A0ABY9S8V8_9ENTR|nr:hypothetical protein [Buttiauxella sp. R73]WMY72487.1 hypothetical protein RHD99_13430 [Buttiauxella sp. R73]